MTDEEYAKVFREYLSKKGISLICSVCSSRSWIVTAPVGTLGMDGSNITLGQGTMPLLPVICRNCKHVMHFAWLAIERGD